MPRSIERSFASRTYSVSTTMSPANAGSTSGFNAIHKRLGEETDESATPTSRPCACASKAWRAPLRFFEECAGRYRRPLALTEVHLACTPDEQVRWVRDVFHDLVGLRRKGVKVAAMTVWSLLGAFDWNSMLTECSGYYEFGAFDVSGEAPRETLLAQYIRALTGIQLRKFTECAGRGWWSRPERLLHEACSRVAC